MTAPSVARQITPPNHARAEARAQFIVVVAWLTYVVAALICLGFLLFDLHDYVSFRAFLYGVLFAALPMPVFLVAVYALDRRRPEPMHLMSVALIWGACVATLIALRVNEFAVARITMDGSEGVRGAIFVAPWVEEAAKALIVFGLVWWQRRRIITPLGAAVYGALVGIGFAFTENVVYYSAVFETTVLRPGGDSGLALDAVKDLFWWRGVAAPFVHPLFTVATGLGIGLALRQRHVGARILAPVAGYLGAVLLHTGFNTLASYATDRALAAIYVGILLPLLLAAIAALLLVRRYDRRLLAARLDDYVATGWLRPWQADAIATARGRRELLRHARRFGPYARTEARSWLAQGIDLAAVRDRIVRGVATDAELRREPVLLDVVRGVLPEHRPAPESVTESADVTTHTARL